MKNIKSVKKLFILSLLSVFTLDLYAMTQDQEIEEGNIVSNKRQRTLNWEVDCETNEDGVIVRNPVGNQMVYLYSKAPQKAVCNVDYLRNSQEDFCCDLTGQWMCLLIDYQLFDGKGETTDQKRDHVLVNPTTGMYLELVDKPLMVKGDPLSGENESIYIDPVTFVPFFTNNQSEKAMIPFLQSEKALVPSFTQLSEREDWVLNNQSEKAIDFLTDSNGDELQDTFGKIYSIRKLADKGSGEVIWSLHTLQSEKNHFINLSEYLKRDHHITVEKVDSHARFLNLEDKQSLLVYVTDQQTGERSQFGIDLLDIMNQHTPKVVFWRADNYSYTAPILTEKNSCNWHEVSCQDLVDKDGVPIQDPEGSRFSYRQVQRRLDDGGLGVPLSCLYMVDRNGKKSGINLGYYLDRDFDCQPTAELTQVRLCGKGKFLQFSTGDNNWALEVSDLKDLRKGTIYSPIMCLNRVVDHTQEYVFSDFIELNLTKSEKEDAMEYGKDIPVYLTILKESFDNYISIKKLKYPWQTDSDEKLRKLFETDMISQLTLFPRDQLRCQDTIAFVHAEDTQEVLQKEVKRGFISNLLTHPDLINSCLYVPSKIKNFEQKKSFKDICFSTQSFFPEKVAFTGRFETDSICNRDLPTKDLFIFLGDTMNKIIFDLSNEDHQLINQVFNNKVIEAIKEKIRWTSHDSNKRGERLNSLICDELETVSNVYSEEFKSFLTQLNWSSISNRDCILGFEDFEFFVNQWCISIDLKNQEYFIHKEYSDENEDVDEDDEESDNEDDQDDDMDEDEENDNDED